MKKILLAIVAISSTLISCQKSNEDKAGDLINISMGKTLYHPESYQAVETKLDSAFSPCDSPEFYEKTLKVVKYGIELNELEEDIKEAKSTMAIWSESRYSAFGKNEYQEAKIKCDAAIENKEKISEKIQNLAEKLKTEFKKGPTFIGFKASHKYRANNNDGNTMIGESVFIFDKDLTAILAEYNTEDEEFIAVQYLYKMMRGEEE